MVSASLYETVLRGFEPRIQDYVTSAFVPNTAIQAIVDAGSPDYIWPVVLGPRPPVNYLRATRGLVPLRIQESEPYRYRTILASLRTLLNTFSCICVKVTTTKGDTYYGKGGIIFDESKEPLIMFGIRYSLSLVGARRVLLVSPKVMTSPDMISKSFRTSIIPALSQDGVEIIIRSLMPYVVMAPLKSQEELSADISELAETISYNSFEDYDS